MLKPICTICTWEIFYYNGNGVKKDFECAMEYYQKAALQSNPLCGI